MGHTRCSSIVSTSFKDTVWYKSSRSTVVPNTRIYHTRPYMTIPSVVLVGTEAVSIRPNGRVFSLSRKGEIFDNSDRILHWTGSADMEVLNACFGNCKAFMFILCPCGDQRLLEFPIVGEGELRTLLPRAHSVEVLAVGNDDTLAVSVRMTSGHSRVILFDRFGQRCTDELHFDSRIVGLEVNSTAHRILVYFGCGMVQAILFHCDIFMLTERFHMAEPVHVFWHCALLSLPVIRNMANVYPEYSKWVDVAVRTRSQLCVHREQGYHIVRELEAADITETVWIRPMFDDRAVATSVKGDICVYDVLTLNALFRLESVIAHPQDMFGAVDAFGNTLVFGSIGKAALRSLRFDWRPDVHHLFCNARITNSVVLYVLFVLTSCGLPNDVALHVIRLWLSRM